MTTRLRFALITLALAFAGATAACIAADEDDGSVEQAVTAEGADADESNWSQDIADGVIEGLIEVATGGGAP